MRQIFVAETKVRPPRSQTHSSRGLQNLCNLVCTRECVGQHVSSCTRTSVNGFLRDLVGGWAGGWVWVRGGGVAGVLKG